MQLGLVLSSWDLNFNSFFTSPSSLNTAANLPGRGGASRSNLQICGAWEQRPYVLENQWKVTPPWAYILIHNPLENMTGNTNGSSKIEGHKAGKITRWQVWWLAPWPVHSALNGHAGLLGPVQSPIEQTKTHCRLLMWLGKAHNLPSQFYFLKTRQLNPWSLKPFAALTFCARAPWVLVPTLPPPNGLSTGKELSSSPSEVLKKRHFWTMGLKMLDKKVAEGLWAHFSASRIALTLLAVAYMELTQGNSQPPSSVLSTQTSAVGQSVVGDILSISEMRWFSGCRTLTKVSPSSLLEVRKESAHLKQWESTQNPSFQSKKPPSREVSQQRPARKIPGHLQREE